MVFYRETFGMTSRWGKKKTRKARTCVTVQDFVDESGAACLMQDTVHDDRKKELMRTLILTCSFSTRPREELCSPSNIQIFTSASGLPERIFIPRQQPWG